MIGLALSLLAQHQPADGTTDAFKAVLPSTGWGDRVVSLIALVAWASLRKANTMVLLWPTTERWDPVEHMRHEDIFRHFTLSQLHMRLRLTTNVTEFAMDPAEALRPDKISMFPSDLSRLVPVPLLNATEAFLRVAPHLVKPSRSIALLLMHAHVKRHHRFTALHIRRGDKVRHPRTTFMHNWVTRPSELSYLERNTRNLLPAKVGLGSVLVVCFGPSVST